MADDLYIRAIEYAIEKDTKFTLGDLFDDLELDEIQQSIVVYEVRFKKLLSSDSSGNVFGGNPRDVIVWCSTEDRFRVLEYYELKEARISAKEARTVAIIAIFISVVSLVSSIVVSLFQIFTPVSLSTKDESIFMKQLNSMKQVERTIGNLTEKYDLLSTKVKSNEKPKKEGINTAIRVTQESSKEITRSVDKSSKSVVNTTKSINELSKKINGK